MFLPFRFFPAEREVAARKEELTVSQWAEKYRVVTKSRLKGPWRNENNPALVGIMDTYSLPYVREIVLCKGVQTGGTEMAYNCLGYEMERSSDMALFVMADESSAKNQMNTRIIPMVEKSSQLARLISANPYDITQKGVALKHGFNLKVGWGTSLVSVASDPCRIVLIDEADKFDQPVIFEEAKARTTTYADTCKIIVLSVPRFENGVLMQELNSCDEVRDFHVPCPSCGVMEPMKFGNQTDPGGVKWPSDQHYKQVRRHESAYYECPHCLAQWNDYKRKEALKAGQWEARNPIRRPKSVGFHFPSWISPFISLSEVASRWIKAKEALAKGDEEPIRVFINNIAAEAYIEAQQGDALQEDDLYKRRYRFALEGATWQVPMGACVLTAFADIQANRVECAVMGWGPGHEAWIIERVVLPGDFVQDQVKADLDRYLQKEWLHESGVKLKIVTAGVDSGYLAPEVYRFVRPRQLGRRIYATKGSSTVGKVLISITDPKKKKGKDKHKVTLINIGTETAKDTIFARFQIEAPGPGYVHFSDSLDYDFFKQLCAEQCVMKYKSGRPYRVWEKKRSDARNEALDLVVGNLAVIEMLNPNLEAIKKQVEVKVEIEEKPEPQPKKAVVSKKKSFVKGWKL